MSPDAVVAHVVAATAVVLALCHLFGAVARRCGQPEVVGQILAGIALGPSVLGALTGDVGKALLPAELTPYLTVVAQLAVILFLVAVGYHLDLRMLGGQRRVVPLVAFAALAVPAALGGGSALAFGALYRPADDGTSTAAFVLFVAVALSITAVPVLASILTERGLSRTVPGVLAMASAGVIDAVGWLALLAVLFLIGGSGSLSLPVTIALFGLYLLVMIAVVRPALRWFLARRHAQRNWKVAIVVTVAMASAAATAALGLHVLFGAFLAGLVLPRTRSGEPDPELLEPLQDIGNLLLPMFFVVAGLSVDLRGLAGQDLGLLALVCVLAIIGKVAGGALGARLAGLGRRDATVVGVLLNTRGLTELIALNIGLASGMIDGRLYTVFVIMALVTTALTGPLLGVLGFSGAPAAAVALRPFAPRVTPEHGTLR